MEENQSIFTYKKNEAPRLIMNFENYDEKQDRSIDDIIFNATKDLSLIGIEEIILRANEPIVIEKVLESLNGATTRVTCQVPLEDSDLVGDVLARYERTQLILFTNSTVTKDNVTIVLNELKRRVEVLENKKVKVVALIIPILKENFKIGIEIAKQIYEELEISVVVDPKVWIFKEEANAISWQELDQLYLDAILYHQKINNYYAILMGQGILPTRLLTEHPCNAYVCKGHSCHSDKRDISRKIILMPDGDLFPESETVNPKFKLGNVKDDKIVNLVNNYFEGEQHQMFRDTVKEVFINYVQVSPYRVVPWRNLFIEMTKESK